MLSPWGLTPWGRRHLLWKEVDWPSVTVQPHHKPSEELEVLPATPGRGLSTGGGTAPPGSCPLGCGSVMLG